MNEIVFDAMTETFHYPDGIIESLREYQYRTERFKYIQELQNALEQMKALYQNPGSLNPDDYQKAKEKIQEAFDYWEMNVFVEFDDFNPPFDYDFEDGN